MTPWAHYFDKIQTIPFDYPVVLEGKKKLTLIRLFLQPANGFNQVCLNIQGIRVNIVV